VPEATIPYSVHPPPGRVRVAPGASDRAAVAPPADTELSPRNTGTLPLFWMIRPPLSQLHAWISVGVASMVALVRCSSLFLRLISAVGRSRRGPELPGSESGRRPRPCAAAEESARIGSFRRRRGQLLRPHLSLTDSGRNGFVAE
jgi:hypothetical protein